MSAENAYYEEAQRWLRDERTEAERRSRRALVVAAAAVGVAGLMAAALVIAMPLRRTEPYLVRVDSASGVVDVVPQYRGEAALPETVLRHLLAEYVEHRERYVAALAEEDYENAGAFHTAAMNESWARQWARSNPESPLNRYADGTRVTVQIRSIVLLKHDDTGDVAQVRFRRQLLAAPGAQERTEDWVATLSTSFARPSDDLRIRTFNPLGFKVLEYQREPEVTADSSDGKGGGT